MKKYEVEIKATVTKTVRVFALNEDDAIEVANNEFTVLHTGDAEKYDQDTLNVRELRPEETVNVSEVSS
jgi:hypothetical protein